MSSATEVRLLTLLNVSAVKRPRELDLPGGHRGSPSASPVPTTKRNGHRDGTANGDHDAKRRKSVTFGGVVGPSTPAVVRERRSEGKGKGKVVIGTEKGKPNGAEANGPAVATSDKEYGVDGLEVEEDGSDDEDGRSPANEDMFNVHFGINPPVLTSASVSAAEANEWSSTRVTTEGYGRAVQLQPGKEQSSPAQAEIKNRVTPSLLTSIKASKSVPPILSTALIHLGSYKDFYLHSLDGEADGSETTLYGESKEAMRKAVVVHALNHVLKTRRRIIRNNEKLAHASASAQAGTSMPEPPRDQSFTRPKVLLIIPLRSLALHYLTDHLFSLAPTGTQIENLRPFTSSFSLPPEAGEDPLSSASASTTFPIDHLVNFRGNSDDNFRIGIKMTRKAWRVVMMPANEAKLMECDILVASPLGLKTTAEKEDSTDLLSSIEICMADGVDIMQMQNWDHVQFIFENMNKIPHSPHGCDFSRVKPWYLDSQAKYLRQTILLSRFDTPEARTLFHRHCHNLQGKVRLDRNDFPGVLGRVRSGVRQVFERIDLESGKGMGGEAAVNEVESRLEWFIKKTVPTLLRSAVSRQNTIVIIPSYFDFVRITAHFRKADIVSFAAISEYSSNSEISRARTLFFKGRKAFLLLTERFHFYRRYRIRGAKTVVFYAPPDHAQFYAEFLHTPFIRSRRRDQEVEEAEVDEGEVSSRVLFSKFDLLRLERVVGSADARRMLSSGEGKFEFV